MSKKIQHVAIIMDGNGRWAKKRLLPRNAGHVAGVKATKKAIQFAAQQGLVSLTLYAFSSENWNRPKDETDHLMNLFIKSLQKEIKEMHANNIKISFIGVRSQLSTSLVAEIESSELLTSNNTGLNLNIALNYGGRSEIVEAVKAITMSDTNIATLTEEQLGQYMYMPDQDDVDLLIRTSGEQRISNFLLWHIAYSELFFSSLSWPDFNHKEFSKALSMYDNSERRFGKTSEQIN
jgi:undecaprenyl diphosphate synthase